MTVIAVLLVIGAVAVFAKNGDFAAEELYAVTKKDVVSTVSVTGTTKPVQSVELSFDVTGRIVFSPYKVGINVNRGAILAQLNRSELESDLLEAQATIAKEEARLNELLRGSREEDVRVAEAKVVQAESALDESESSYRDAARDAYVKSDDAVRGRMDQFFLTPRTNPRVFFYIPDAQLKVNLEAGRVGIEKELEDWRESVLDSAKQVSIKEMNQKAEEYLASVQQLLDYAARALNDSRPDQNVSQTSLDAWKASLSIARVNVSGAETALRVSSANLAEAQTLLVLRREESLLTKAGSSLEEIQAQRAILGSARAREGSVEAQLQRLTVRAPFAGVVTRQEAKVGEIASAGTPLITIMSDDEFEIESRVPEVDIASVKKGNVVRVTFDALRDEEFEAVLDYIEPAETQVQGVSYYKIIAFLTDKPKDFDLKSGLTVNLDIEVSRVDNVLAVPVYAVHEGEDGSYVNVVSVEKAVTSRTVELGERGSDGYVEVRSGLEEGDVILLEGD